MVCNYPMREPDQSEHIFSVTSRDIFLKVNGEWSFLLIELDLANRNKTLLLRMASWYIFW